jgi:hypothetical protein
MTCLLVLLAGCASKPRAAARPPAEEPGLATTSTVMVTASESEESSRTFATALVFALPVEQYGEPLELNRDRRERRAFLGFDEGVTEYFAVRQDDRQSFGRGSQGDQFERRAVTLKTGVRYR